MGRTRRGYRPSVEGMERRELLATAPNGFLQPTGQPSAHERVRQDVRFVFQGSFIQARGRTSDQESQILIRGVGSSTIFLHGDLQMGLVMPTDPLAPVGGAAA